MALFEWVYRYFWVIAIAVGLINTAITWYRLQNPMQTHPERVPGYRALLRGYGLINTLPWLVMGIGIVFGGVPDILYYLYPGLGNPYVLAWWGTLGLMHAWLIAWLVWNGGAEMLIAHPGFLRGNFTSAKQLKLYGLCSLAAITTVTVLIFSQTPTDLPRLPGSF